MLTVLSVITIIGWAWVYAAWMRWICRNIQGTRREVMFIGSGLEFLWRTIVVSDRLRVHHPDSMDDAMDITWLASQTVLAERAHPNG